MLIDVPKHVLLSSVAFVGLWTATGASAQTPTAPDSAAQPNAPQASPQPQSGLQDIVVTARRFAESAQRTPVSITTFSNADLKTKLIQGAADLQRITPSLTVYPFTTAPQGLTFSLRGQVQTDTAAFAAGSVGVYYDDVYIGGASLAGGLLSLEDLERVEVLKGPQGTLYGRNVTGGLVKFVTDKPTDKFGAYMRAGVGNYSRRFLDGMVNVPIADNVAFRIDGNLLDHSGYARDINNNGRDLEDQHQYSFRAALKAEVGPRLHVLLQGWYGQGHDNGNDPRTSFVDPTNATALLNIVATQRINGQSPQSLAPLIFGAKGGFTPAQIGAAGAAFQAAIPQALALVQQYYNAPRDQAHQPANPSVRSSDHAKIGGGAATIAYDLSDNATIKSITAYTYSQRNSFFNVGGGPWMPLYTNQYGSVSQFTQEGQLTGKALDSRLKYTAGIYYLHQNIQDNRRDSSQFGAYPLFLGQLGLGVTNGSFSVNKVVDESVAAYGQASFELVHGLNLTGGLRYTHEKFSIATNQIQRTGIAAGFVPYCNSAAPTTASTPLAQCFASDSTSFHNLSYTAGADWTVTPGVLVYAKTSKGFKGGGINPFGSAGAPFIEFQPETNTDYEVGIKSDFLNRRVRVNLDFYHTSYDGIQRTVTTIIAPGQFGTGIRNAATAKIDGIEAELNVVPVRGLTLGATAAYINARYSNYTVLAPAFPGGVLDLSDQPFQTTPKYTYSLNGNYRFSTSWADVTTNLEWAWRSRAVLFVDDSSPRSPGGAFSPSSAIGQNSYGLLSGSLTFDLTGRNASVRIWSQNMLNKRYSQGAGGLVNVGLGYSWKTFGPPRTFGADLTVRF